MSDFKIGDWAARFRGEEGAIQATRAHLIDSLVAKRAVMRCGKEMDLKTRYGRLVESEFSKCSACDSTGD